MLAGIKFSGWAQNCQCENIGGFKFGGSVRDRHMYYVSKKYWWILIWWLQKADYQTAKFTCSNNHKFSTRKVCF